MKASAFLLVGNKRVWMGSLALGRCYTRTTSTRKAQGVSYAALPRVGLRSVMRAHNLIVNQRHGQQALAWLFIAWFLLAGQSARALAEESLQPGELMLEEIRVVSPDYWCPFGCEANSSHEGYPIDILRAIFEPRGIKITYSNLNYSRAIIETRKGRFTLIPSVFKEEAPDFIFSRQTISDSRYCFYSRADSSWTFTGADSLKNMRIGAIKSYSYGELIDKAIAKQKGRFELQAGNNLTERLVRMLVAGRLDVFIENEYLVAYNLLLNPDVKLREAGCEASSSTYIAFSPGDNQLGQKYADMFDAGLLQLRASGALEKIMARYGLRDWAQVAAP